MYLLQDAYYPSLQNTIGLELVVRQEGCLGLGLLSLLRFTSYIFLAQDAPFLMYGISLQCNACLYCLHLSAPGSRNLIKLILTG